MGPFLLEDTLGKLGASVIFFLIGAGFGASLEMSGFGNSTKLAAQFYFKDMTVLKVMFTGIVVAMILVFLFAGLGLLDYERLWVPPTYLWPGIVGGLIMGVGFIIGGFCPGTSLVALATLKIDGLFFFLGALAGVFLFGETVSSFETFWHSSEMGRFILPEWLGISTGLTVLIVVVMALAMFLGAEAAERFLGKPASPANRRWLRRIAALCLVGGASVLVIGQPTLADKWDRVADRKQPLLDNREVQIEPAELLHLMSDYQVNLVLIDVRSEASFNLFHLTSSHWGSLDELARRVGNLLRQPEGTVVVLMSEDEERATQGWKILVAEDVPNVYLLEGGLNNWLEVFGHLGHEDCPPAETVEIGEERLRHRFRAAIGDADPASAPEEHESTPEYVPKVKIERKKALGSGGCG